MSAQKNKFNINDKVVILGSENLLWVIENFKKDEEHKYTYSMKLKEGEFVQESLPWIPECLLSLKVL